MISCNYTQQNNIINEPPFITSDTLIHQNIQTEEVFGSAMCMFLMDSILFITDHFNRDTAIWGLHIGQKKITKAYGRKGRGPGEISFSPSSNIQYNLSTKEITLYDPNYKKLIQYNIKDTTFFEYRLPYRDSLLKSNFVQDIVKTDSFYICMGTGDLFSKGKRFLIYNKSYELINVLNGYPTINIPKEDIAEIYQYGEEIHVKPDGSKFVFTSYIGGTLEIFDLQHLPDSIPNIARNIYYNPIYEKSKSGSISALEKTIYGFENVYVTNNAIYCLLFDYKQPTLAFPNKIIIYNWNGEWLKSYSLDCMLHSLCVDEKNKIIYGMAFSEKESFHLVYFNLKNN